MCARNHSGTDREWFLLVTQQCSMEGLLCDICPGPRKLACQKTYDRAMDAVDPRSLVDIRKRMMQVIVEGK